MPVVLKFLSVARGHPCRTIRLPPHMSIYALGRECTVEIDSLAMTGTIPTREIHKELQWIKANRAQLNA
jgi:hypothetical protein